MDQRYPVQHRCPLCGQAACPIIVAGGLDFVCPACREAELVQIEFPERRPVLMTGRWGWIVGFCAGTILLVVVHGGLGYDPGLAGGLLMLVIASISGEAVLPRRERTIAGSGRVLTRAERDRVAPLRRIEGP